LGGKYVLYNPVKAESDRDALVHYSGKASGDLKKATAFFWPYISGSSFVLRKGVRF
jgi:hypothetical protein